MNNNIKESYCSFEVSKLLKEKGFEVPVDRYYIPDGNLYFHFEKSNGESESYFDSDYFFENRNKKGWVIDKNGSECFGCKHDNINYFISYSCPTHAVALEWLRVNFNIYISIEMDYSHSGERMYFFGKTKHFNDGFVSIQTTESYEIFNDATEAALKYVLKNLV